MLHEIMMFYSKSGLNYINYYRLSWDIYIYILENIYNTATYIVRS